VHLGNAFLAGVDLKKADLKASSNLTDLSSRFDTSKYLSPYSDTVALTVLDHTVRMQNMITRANFNSLLVLNDPSKPKPEVVKKEISEASEALLMYMLCQDEGKFNGQITGVNDFRKEFEARGPRDSKGRSLHELDLNKHLFKYSCSYLVYSPAFDGLPVPTKEYLFRRLSEILSGKDQGRIYGRMPAKSKQEVFEILWDTKPEFRAWCQAHGTSEPVTVG
jgi:hypothetical protein